MSRLALSHAGVLGALAVAIFMEIGCGGPTPPPQPTPIDSPSGSPGADGSPLPKSSAGAVPSPSFQVDPGALTELPPQPDIPGLYLPAGVLAQGTDHYALIQARTDCQTLTGVLGAGEWTLVDRGTLVIPTPDPAQPTPAMPMPELSLPEWLLLHWAGEYAVARVGGDENGCLAQVWRLAHGEYVAHGAVESTGSANALQVMCAAGSGVAEIGALYFGADGTFFNLQTTVPLEVGSHALGQDTGLHAGRQGPTVEAGFRLLFGGSPDSGDQEMPGIESYFPADFGAGGWPGSIEVTSVDPLEGEITFEGLVNEAGEPLTLSTAFRCDLPPGQLARAAEAAANATPSPEPSPSPAPGRLSVEIADGPHAGTQEVTSSDVMCSFGLFSEGDWTASYGAPEPVAGEVQSLTVTVHASGKADVFMTLGDDFEDDWFNTDDAQAEVTDNGTSVEFAINGHAAGSDFTIDFTCYDIARF